MFFRFSNQNLFQLVHQDFIRVSVVSAFCQLVLEAIAVVAVAAPFVSDESFKNFVKIFVLSLVFSVDKVNNFNRPFVLLYSMKKNHFKLRSKNLDSLKIKCT